VSGAAANLWAELPLGREVRVLATDANGLGALGKPAGLLSHPNKDGEGRRALIDAEYDPDGECYKLGGPGNRRLWLLNRLDSATSGVILVCTDETLAGVVKRAFRSREVHKRYVALVFGRPAMPAQTWRDKLEVTRREGRIRTRAGGGLTAECRMALMRSGGGHSLLQLEPLTGRSHQLRVQCARRHLPIVGDQTYGDFPRNREFAKRTGCRRLFLHSLEVRLEYEHKGRKRQFEATDPLPAEFEQVGRG
jgi:tRNA pseudouridine65 synthase